MLKDVYYDWSKHQTPNDHFIPNISHSQRLIIVSPFLASLIKIMTSLRHDCQAELKYVNRLLELSEMKHYQE